MIRIIERLHTFDLAGYRTARFIPPHPVRKRDHRDAIARSLRLEGWTGRPLLGVARGASVRPILLTGSHRHAALCRVRAPRLRIPVLLVTLNLDPRVACTDDLYRAVLGLLAKGGDNDDTLARLIALERLAGVSLKRSIALMRRENREGR